MTRLYDGLRYPEGPVFGDNGLLLADMLSGAIMRYRDGTVTPVLRIERCGPTALARMASGHWLAACHLSHEIITVDFAPSRVPHVIARWSLRRPNDVAAGPAGVYVSESGEFDARAPATGKIWFVARPGRQRLVASGLRYANGVAVTNDHRHLLVCEHLARRVWRYPLEPDGALGARRLAFAFEPDEKVRAEPLTGPDGIEAAPDGSFYVAINGRGTVVHVSANGNVLERFETSGYAYTTNVVLTPGGKGLYAVANRRSPKQDGALFYTKLSD
jgi:sugar lactone lactonase YvrE